MRWKFRIPVKALCGWIAAAAITLGVGLPVSAQSKETSQSAPADITLVVPGAAGGGWDLTAKAMKEALLAEGLAHRVEIVRYPGAGGLVGISQFAARYRGNPNALMIGGLVMLGSTMRDEAAVTLRDVTPIARLTGDWEVIAVPAGSQLKSVADLRAVMQAQPDALRWAGGALGGPDQGVVWSIASALGAPLEDVPYYGKPGGGRVAESLVAGRHMIGVSGYAEFEPFLKSGKLRLLAVAAPRRIDGITAPTLREGGIDVSIMNWRGVFGAPGLDEGQEQRLIRLVDAMRQSPTWRTALARQHWSDSWLAESQFTQFLDREQQRWSNVINPLRDAELTRLPGLSALRPLALLQAALALAIVITAALGYRLRLRRRAAEAKEAELEEQRNRLSGQIAKFTETTVNLIKDGVDEDFGEWNLSSAERDIAWFMLRGLPLKQIALVRGTSERTVRQQAQAIYRKAGLEGRSDLAGRVLERFI